MQAARGHEDNRTYHSCEL